jgi:hypothetical protein
MLEPQKKSKLLFSLPSPLPDDTEILNGPAIDLTGVTSETEETQWTGSVENIINSDGSDWVMMLTRKDSMPEMLSFMSRPSAPRNTVHIVDQAYK